MDIQRLPEAERLLVEALRDRFGGRAGNKSLRESLQISEEVYWVIRNSLIEKGILYRGMGKGGSVGIVEEPPVEPATVEVEAAEVVGVPSGARPPEEDLYAPAREAVLSGWIKEQGYDNSVVEVTGRMGRAATGGTWTRPDISVFAVQKFEYWPTGLFDLITFEIKPSDSIDVKAVYEAVSHQKSATQSYVLFACSKEQFDEAAEAERIVRACKDHGIGLILAAHVENFDEWDELLPATRVTANLRGVDRFIKTFFSDEGRAMIARLTR